MYININIMYHISYILQILLTYHLLHISRLTFNPQIYQRNGEVNLVTAPGNYPSSSQLMPMKHPPNKPGPQ